MSQNSTSLRRPVRPGHASITEQPAGTTMTVGRYGDAEWEAKDAMRQRELEESRARAAQMEKTMRWWSDCTANWREKWSKVRNERNKAREDLRLLRIKFDNNIKDTNDLKREKTELQTQNDELKKELEKLQSVVMSHVGKWDKQIISVLELDDVAVERTKNDGESSVVTQECSEDSVSSTLEQLEATDDDGLRETLHSLTNAVHEDIVDLSPSDEEHLLQKLSMLQLRLEESLKTIQVEREENANLHRSMERLQQELSETREKFEDLKLAKQDTVRELLSLQDIHRDTVMQIQADLQDETSSRETVDRRLADLRTELERLQAENAAEWGKRERLETEKLALERDNKKLRAEVRDLQERLERRGHTQHSGDTELRVLQQELNEKVKELQELKHSHSKLKKVLGEKMTELAHAVRRAEQFETEVKRLRARVEELKRELAMAEDELDSATNSIRKLQRSNDELQEQVDNLQVQLGHLHTRLRTNNSSSLLAHRKPSQEAALSDEEH